MKILVAASFFLLPFALSVAQESNLFLSPTDKGPFPFPSFSDPKLDTKFSFQITQNYSIAWSLSPPTDPNSPPSLTNNQNVTVTLKATYGTHNKDHWAYMAVACGKSMLHAHFIMARYFQGRCWLAEHYPQHTYSAPVLITDSSKYLVTPISCNWGGGNWTVQFTRPMFVDPNDEFHRMSWSVDTGRDYILAAYQFNSVSVKDYHGKTQRARLEVNWKSGYVGIPKTPEINDRITHGVGMMVAWLVLFPFGVFYARYFKYFHLVLVHASIQVTGLLVVLTFFIYILSVNESHLVNAHHIYGLVLVILITLQATLGVLNRLGLQFESIAKVRTIVRRTHDLLGPFVLVAAAVQIALGLNIVFPYQDVYGTGNNYREGGVIIWYVYFALVIYWVLLFAAMEIYFFLYIRQSEPVFFKKAKTSSASTVDLDRKKKEGYVPGKSFELDNLSGLKPFVNEKVHQPTPMQLVAVSNAEKKVDLHLEKFTWKSLDEAIMGGKMFVVANGKYVYDIAQWIYSHPGGQIILNAVCGTDITSDYFHEAGFDVSEHLPKTKSQIVRRKSAPIPPRLFAETVTSPDMKRMTLPEAQIKELEIIANAQFAQNFTESDWQNIMKSRRPHLHTRNAIEKLSSLLVGELVSGPTDLVLKSNIQSDAESGNDKIRFSSFEYKRYALTETQVVSGPNSRAKSIRMRFCLLYPYTFTNAEQTEELNKLLTRPFIPGECVEIQCRIPESTKRVNFARYYTPISGSLMAFEIIVKIVEGGKLTPFLAKQKIGGRQFKIRGPFGNPLLIGPEHPIQSNSTATLLNQDLITTHDRVTFFTAGSGITPFLQFLKWTLLPEFQPLEVLHPYTASQVDELTLTPKTFVAVKQHNLDGWAYGIDLFNQQEGTFPLPVTSPPFPRVYNSGNSVFLKCFNSVESGDEILGGQIIEGSLLAYPNLVNVTHFIGRGDTATIGQQAYGEARLGRITPEMVKEIVQESYEGLSYSSKPRERPVFVICGPRGYSGMLLDALHNVGVSSDEVLVLSDTMYL
ncbi:hypothetical protein HK098_001649 [Nowakowskiella sp. JEL0407]|nr:hypothetical protein HK098_001649 [Nowakowskiella sp. JEL0407]